MIPVIQKAFKDSMKPQNVTIFVLKSGWNNGFKNEEKIC